MPTKIKGDSFKNSINFTINEVPYTVSGDIPANTSLNVYIRDYAKLRGTKAMCHEGGCGACIVAAEIKGETLAVNSCLVPVFICDGWAIRTIEGIGNKKDGYHTIQATLAVKNGSQCGYCSPGMVMNLYSLVKDKKLTMQEIENSFGSNICRCTGYRPILNAFKGFASDAPKSMVKDIRDIEELYNMPVCRNPKTGELCKFKSESKTFSDSKLSDIKCEHSEFFHSGNCRNPKTGERCTFKSESKTFSDAKPLDIESEDSELYNLPGCQNPKTEELCKIKSESIKYSDAKPLDIKLEDSEFLKVYTVDDLFAIFQQYPKATYILNGGNTANGVYRVGKNDLRIDINDIKELRNIEKSKQSLTIGGNISLTLAMRTFQKYSSETGFKYLQHLVHHIDLIASVPVRNIGTLAGNLMIKHAHHEFPSDLFLILETAGSQVHILEGPGRKQSMMLQDFLKTDMRHKIIYSIVLPALSDEYKYRSYKIMPRAQNAHAHVNAGFLFKLDGGGKVLEKPNIIFGGINEKFLHAKKTEELLVNKSIFDKQVLKTALETLHNELQPDHVLPDGSPEFRKTLSEGLFYKFVLSIRPENLNSRLRSGSTILERGLSSGVQDYDTDEKIWPVNKPLAKVESIHQTSGEAQYCNDLPPYPEEVFCAFVTTEVGNGKIESIDASKALALKGVVAFFSAKDVPGKNVCIPGDSKLLSMDFDEILFAEKDVLYASQPVGVIVAETHNLANEATKLVEIKYSEFLKRKPILSIEDALAAQDDKRFKVGGTVPRQKKGDNVKHVIKDVFQCGGQYHYTMETQSSVCVPVEDGIDVYPTTQWIDLTQVSIAKCLGIKNNSINISVRRLGGAYGAKISRNAQVNCACALVCHKLNRPARFILSIESNMQSLGKRMPTRQEYEIGVDDQGVIQYLNSKHWSNAGCSFNEGVGGSTVNFMQSCYVTDIWDLTAYEVQTDIPSNTFCRAPGSTEGIAMSENIMDHIARVTKKDPLEVRLANMNDVHKPILEKMIKDLLKSADYNMRKQAIEVFNNENRWKKKGISVVPMRYPLFYFGQFNAMVSVCARDGTVVVSHGGIECGQGMNTKIAQVVAYSLGIDLELVTVKPTNNITAPNNIVTGGSVTSESCAYAAIQCCKEILKRLEPIKKEMNNPSWKELVLEAYEKDVDLCARYMSAPSKDTALQVYNIYGVTIAEVEIDMLTGQHIIRRVDLVEDCGVSLNPEVDLGQIEGAFVMGIGYWTSEELVYDPKTGALTNYRTWNYKPPGAKDIPVDFRVSFLKNSTNSVGVLRSKATGEPPLCMAIAIPLAMRHAMNSARADAGNTDDWYRSDAPFTNERIIRNSLTSKDNMVL